MANELVIHARERNLGGFSVHRSLPSPQKRSVGPFVFLDHMGPLKVDEKHLLDVRPHPHIGLATVTYLFQGRGWHRDSIGSSQIIVPGDLNWMTAGRGIVHSERTPPEDQIASPENFVHGIQIWIGLPVTHEECTPSFTHWASERMPTLKLGTALTAKLLIGTFQTEVSPVQTFSRTLFMDLRGEATCSQTLTFTERELGIFLVQGSGHVNGTELKTEDLIVMTPGADGTIEVKIECVAGSRLIVIGGDPFPEPRYLWWNFVSSDKTRIREAAELWRTQQMGVVPGESDFIPLPQDPLP